MSISQEEELKKIYFLRQLNSPQDLRDWVMTYIGIDLPHDTVDKDSNSNPIDAMWEIYEAIKLNKGDEIPGYIMLSAREGYKTLSASILEILILSHFQLSIAHMAAIASQSNKAISYIQSFLIKLKPYYDYHNWVKVGDSKSKIQFQTPEGNSPYITVIICTLTGANSEHVPIMFLDEVDVVRDPQAYDEARAIPGMERGVFPITVKLSTRKFAFGMMQKELESAKETGEIVKRWNIIDITEKCPTSRFMPNPNNEKKDEVWVTDKLPLKTSALNDEQYSQLPDSQKSNWEKIKVHPGCLKCELVSVCRGRLADKPDSAVSSKVSLYKPIKATIRAFTRLPPDMGEAQLMCWRPSTKGLVYPRFEPTHSGNLIDINKAWELVTGDVRENVTLEELVSKLHELDANFFAGVDWGYTHESTIVVVAVLASGYSIALDTYASPGLEPHDFAEIALTYQNKYGIYKWFCDQAAPQNIKTFKKKGMRCPEFKKDVLGGIDALRSQIITSSGARKFLVLDIPENQKLVQGFKVHHFKLDMAGNPTTTPDDEEYADVMDAARYLAQNVYTLPGTKPVVGVNQSDVVRQNLHKAINADPASTEVAPGVNSELMKQEVAKRVQQPTSHLNDDNNKKKRVFWDMS
jgi:hypothetical protein